MKKPSERLVEILNGYSEEFFRLMILSNLIFKIPNEIRTFERVSSDFLTAIFVHSKKTVIGIKWIPFSLEKSAC